MRERTRKDLTDGVGWFCPHCKSQKSIREGSFFAKSRITLQKWLMLLYLWAREYPVSDARDETLVTKTTAVNVYQWLREVCSTALLNTPTKLGGPGVVLQIDESQFTHKPKVNLYEVEVMKLLRIYTFRIIGEDQQERKYGCLAL